MASNLVLAQGSLAETARHEKRPIAEVMASTMEAIALVDISGSMNEEDSEGGRSRWAVAQEKLGQLQCEHPGKIGLVAWSKHAQIVTSGVLPPPHGSTDLARALRFIAPYAEIVDLWVISDGEPDSQEAALRAARALHCPIHTIYVGPEGGDGADFLRRLAKETSGTSGTAERVIGLLPQLQRLALAGGKR